MIAEEVQIFTPPTRPLPPTPSDLKGRMVPKMGIAIKRNCLNATSPRLSLNGPSQSRKIIGTSALRLDANVNYPRDKEGLHHQSQVVYYQGSDEERSCSSTANESTSYSSVSIVNSNNNNGQSEGKITQPNRNSGLHKFDKLLKFNFTPATIFRSKIFPNRVRDKSLPNDLLPERKKVRVKSKSLSRLFETKQDVVIITPEPESKSKAMPCNRSWTIKTRNDGSRYLIRKKIENKKRKTIGEYMTRTPDVPTLRSYNEPEIPANATIRKSAIPRRSLNLLAESRRSSHVVTMLVV